jgi:hypothetical protein
MSTYEQLFSDPRFLNTRIEEQIEYMDELVLRPELSVQRREELMEAAAFQFDKFKKRLTEVLLYERQAFEEDGFLWIISCKDETTIKRIARGNVKERKNDTPVTT